MRNQLLIDFNSTWNDPLRGKLEKHPKGTKVFLPFSQGCRRQRY